MDGGYIGLIAITFSGLMIFLQRIEPRHRRALRNFILFLAVGLWLLRYHLRNEHLIGCFIALTISFFFWLFIGRYNPVRSTDDTIKVYGLND
ncbi:MAG: hypothetical protein MUE40_09515 [Anaerolineae bacterium]|nr:hypothetical protein [Anaerolineae bacterium]